MTTRICKTCGAAKPLAAFPNRQLACNGCRQKSYHASGETDWYKYFIQRLQQARTRSDNVTVTANDLVEMLVDQGGCCALSGIKLTRQRGDLTKASIDRINPGGYNPDNVRLVAWAVNRMRNTVPDAEFSSWVKALAAHGRLEDTAV